MDQFLEFQVCDAVVRLRALLRCRILWHPNFFLFMDSVLIEVLIHLHFLLKLADKMGNRIAFTDDVIRTEDINDVTDLIIYFRNAFCHDDSFLRRHQYGGISHLNRVFGRFKGDNIEVPYDDEIAVNTGDQWLFQKRHIERAYEELVIFFRPLVSDRDRNLFERLQYKDITLFLMKDQLSEKKESDGYEYIINPDSKFSFVVKND
jgi:hypothetical protein